MTDFHLKRPPDPVIGVAAKSDERTERIRLTARDLKREQAELLMA